MKKYLSLLAVKKFLGVWPLFDQLCPNWPNFFPINLAQILIFNIPLYSKFKAEFKSFYRIQFAFHVLKIFKFYSARSVNFYCKTWISKKVHQPKIEIPENLKKHFSKTTFYGLHAGNNLNLIWKPHLPFACRSSYFLRSIFCFNF